MLQLPSADGVARLLSGLLGRPVEASAGKREDGKLTICGLYHSGDSQNVAVLAMDAALGGYAGVGLMLIPVASAEEQIGRDASRRTCATTAPKS